MEMEAALRNSIMKSRSLTVSMAFSVGAEKPRASAVACRSMGRVVPARAQAPRGQKSVRARQS